MVIDITRIKWNIGGGKNEKMMIFRESSGQRGKGGRLIKSQHQSVNIEKY